MPHTNIHFCSQCGAKVSLNVPSGDNRERHVCDNCGHIHYQNPRIITGIIANYDEKILLCRRAIEPRYGLWTLPAGFMENGETSEQGALRECWEEACAKPEVDALYTVLDLPQFNQVYLFYRATLAEPSFDSGEESLETALFSEEEIPWNELAFSVVRRTLELYLADRRRGEFGTHRETILHKLPA